MSGRGTFLHGEADTSGAAAGVEGRQRSPDDGKSWAADVTLNHPSADKEGKQAPRFATAHVRGGWLLLAGGSDVASILIADDDPTVRMIATELLRDGDYAIIEAADGELALKVIESVPIDLIVLDLLMPNRDGLEVIQTIRESHPEVRILAISSGGRLGAVSYLETARVFGADEVMAKPLRVTTFVSTIERLLNQPSRQQGPWALAS